MSTQRPEVLEQRDDLKVPLAAVNMLEAKRRLLLQVVKTDPAHYSAVNDITNASMGAHMRHSLDHFSKLLADGGGHSEPRYDHRDRGTNVETDMHAAIAQIKQLTAAVVRLDAASLKRPGKICHM